MRGESPLTDTWPSAVTAPEAASRNPQAAIQNLVYLALVGAGLALAAVFVLLTSRSVGNADFQSFLLRTDYPAFLTGARLIAGGQGVSLYDPAVQTPIQQAILAPYNYPRGLLPYNHLPFLAVALAPISGLPVQVSYGIWLGATALALLAALILLGREMAAVARTPAEARWAPRALWALSLGFFPVYQALLQVQTAPWDLLGYTLMVRYLRQGREIAAGLALALVLVKPQLLIVPLLVLLYTRRWRVLAAFAALGGGLALLVTPLLGGFGWIGRYLVLLGNVAAGPADSSMVQPVLMENLRGFFVLLAFQFDPAARGTGNAAWVVPLTALASLAVLALLAWAWRPQLRSADRGLQIARSSADTPQSAINNPQSPDRLWAATLIAALLVSPHGFAYELVLLLLPSVLIWRAARSTPDPAAVPRAALLLVVGYLAATLTLPILALPNWPIHLGVVAMLGAVVILCVPAGRVVRFPVKGTA